MADVQSPFVPGPQRERRAPPDKGHAAYWLLVLQGVAMLFPWNAYITAGDYFSEALKGTFYAESFESFFSVGYMTTTLISFAVVVRYQHLASERARVLFALVITAVVFATTTGLSLVEGLAPELIFATSMGCVMISAMAAALMQSAEFSMAAFLGHDGLYVQAVLLGQGLAGSIVAISAILTTSLGQGTTAEVRGFCYFLISTIVVIGAIFGFLALERLDFVKYSYSRRAQIAEGCEPSADPLTEPGSFASAIANEKGLREDASGPLLAGGLEDSSVSVKTPQYGWKSLVALFGKIKGCAFAVFLIFAVTLALFPTVISMVEESADVLGNIFTPFLFLMFNLGDLGGRTAAGWETKLLSPRGLVIFSVARVTFFPLMLICNVQSGYPSLPVFDSVLLKNDAFPAILTLLIGLSNGYCATLAMMYGPAAVNEKDSGTAGMLMAFALDVGLTTGSLLSFGIRGALCQCNPFVSS